MKIVFRIPKNFLKIERKKNKCVRFFSLSLRWNGANEAWCEFQMLKNDRNGESEMGVNK